MQAEEANNNDMGENKVKVILNPNELSNSIFQSGSIRNKKLTVKQLTNKETTLGKHMKAKTFSIFYREIY